MRSFNEAVGYYRRNRGESSAWGVWSVACFNEAVGYYRRNHAYEVEVGFLDNVLQ